MGIRALLQLATLVPDLISELKRAGDDIREVRNELAQLQSEHEKLDLAFTSFRQRVYAWRKGEPVQQEPKLTGDPDRPLDKAAILAAHRSKQQ